MKIQVIGKIHSTGTYKGFDYDNTQVQAVSTRDLSEINGIEGEGLRTYNYKVKSIRCPYKDIEVGEVYEVETNRFDEVVVFNKI